MTFLNGENPIKQKITIEQNDDRLKTRKKKNFVALSFRRVNFKHMVHLEGGFVGWMYLGRQQKVLRPLLQKRNWGRLRAGVPRSHLESQL